MHRMQNAPDSYDTSPSITGQLQDRLSQIDPSQDLYAIQFVEVLLEAARDIGASDIHLQPTSEGLELRWRLDGVLQSLGLFPKGDAADVIVRLKVLAELLTYRTDIPQEGRIHQAPGNVEIRVSTFPTLHGERAVLRLFAGNEKLMHLDDLGLPADIFQMLQSLLVETSGAVLITGPAGSGKTTTAYACLRELVGMESGQKSIVSLEDPIEVALNGVSQSQVNPAAGFDLATGLRSLMRQDPEVIFVGEIRDSSTAETVFGTALTGHLVLTTFHSTSASGAISRLSDMGIEPYLLRSGIRAVLNQRLVRRLCQCSTPIDDDQVLLNMPVQRAFSAQGCDKCFGTGYCGRTVLAELITPEQNEVGRAILSRSDANQIEQLAISSGMTSRWQRACQAVESGLTSPAEIRRVLGFGTGNFTTKQL